MNPRLLRYASLLLATVGMDAAWLSAWTWALGRTAAGGAVGWGPLWVAGAALVAWNRWLWGRDHAASGAASLLGALVAVSLLWWSLVPEAVGFVPGAWWRAATGLFRLLGTAEPLTVIALAALALWVRTVRLAQEPVTFWTTVRRFRAGALLVGASALFAALSGATLPGATVFLYFACGLVALALARAGEVEGVGALPVGGRWLATLLGGVGGAMALAGVATLLFSRRGMAALGEVLSPVGAALGALFSLLVHALALLLVPLIQGLYANIPPTPEVAALPTVVAEATEEAATELAAPPGPAADLFLLLFGLLVVAGLLYLLFRLLRRRRRGSGGMAVPDVVGEYGSAAVNWSAGDWLRRQAAALGARFQRDAPRSLGIETVRDLYRNLLLFGEQQGVPRPAEATPYEFLRPLCDHFPQRRADFLALTDAYVATHYGEHRFSRSDIARLQAAWRRIETERRAE